MAAVKHTPLLKSAAQESPTAEPTRRETLMRLLRYLIHYPLQLALAVALFVAGTVTTLIPGVLTGVAINEHIAVGELDGLLDIIVLIGLAAAASWLFTALGGVILSDLVQKALYEIRREIFEHIQILSLSFYDRQPIGELMSRILNDLNAISQFFENGLNALFSGVFMLVTITIVMLLINVSLTVAVLLILPFTLGVIAYTSNVAGPAFVNLQRELGDLNGFMEETITGDRIIKAYKSEDISYERLTDISENARKSGIRANFISMTVQPLSNLLMQIDLALVALVGGWLAVRGVVEVGTVATFLLFSKQFARPLTQIAQTLQMVLQALAGSQRIFQILDEQPEIADKPGAVPLQVTEGRVVVRDLDFSYVPGRQVLYDINIDAQPGEKIGLCGPTGAGKSTIINLIPRFYDIQRGDILIDGHSIYDVTVDSLRGQVGIVLQEPFLFSDTVMNNLRYGRLEASNDDCIEAAKIANAHDFIVRLPQGYDTVLAEGGSNLSQGQRQLITIARALLSQRKVLILDEATSSVDTRTEAKLQAALEELMAGSTSFVIAHRLSTITDSNSIIALERGHIADKGPHAELMKSQGFYYRLYMSQFKEELLRPKT